MDLVILTQRCDMQPAIFSLIATAPFDALSSNPVATIISPLVSLYAAVAIALVRDGRVSATIIGLVIDSVTRGLRVSSVGDRLG